MKIPNSFEDSRIRKKVFTPSRNWNCYFWEPYFFDRDKDPRFTIYNGDSPYFKEKDGIPLLLVAGHATEEDCAPKNKPYFLYYGDAGCINPYQKYFKTFEDVINEMKKITGLDKIEICNDITHEISFI